jgi:hypothetical protein
LFVPRSGAPLDETTFADDYEWQSEVMLDPAGQWLARLSSPPCARLRRRMAERWAASCEGAAIPQAKMAAIRDRYGEQIAAAVS